MRSFLRAALFVAMIWASVALVLAAISAFFILVHPSGLVVAGIVIACVFIAATLAVMDDLD